jgi:hypothetical protein
MKTTFRSIPIGIPNKNGRIYNPEIMTKVIEEYNLSDKKLVGQLGHPENADIIDMKGATHSIKNVFLKKLKVPRKMKKEMKKKGTYDSTKQLYVEIKYFPVAQKIKDIIHQLALTPSFEGSQNEDGSVDVKRLLSFNFVPKNETAFKKYL